MQAILICLILWMPMGLVTGQSLTFYSSEEQAVLHVIDLFFQSMTAKDTTGAKTILMMDGQYYGVDAAKDTASIFMRTHLQYLERFGTRKETVVERYWNPEIKIRGRIAQVWTPYDFYIDGVFSHCGIDAFSLLKTNEGWKIASTLFTMEPLGCEASPLGRLQKKD